MNRRLWVALVLGACGVETPDESQIEAYGTEQQGTEQQGTEQQGTEQQGTEQQGTEQQGGGYVGTPYEDTTYVSSSLSNTRVSYNGTAISSASLSKTTLELWKRNANRTWTQRLPNAICTWDEELVQSTCTTVNLATQASPLAGARFWSTFKRADGTSFLGWVQIGTGPGHVGAVKVDPSYAMHPLTPTTGVNNCALDTTCDHPVGCRKNCDLFVYDLRLYNVFDDDNQLVKFCPNTSAYPLMGTWDATGQRTSPSNIFTFSCMNGTLAKCTKWGYRPFGNAKNSGGISESLAGYHQSCVRAAKADYCGVQGSGHSFTKNGTLIDIYDYFPHQTGSHGFIPNTESYLHTQGGATQTMFVWESDWDNKGATYLDLLRYSELTGSPSYGSLEDEELGCPRLFTLPVAGEDEDDPHRPRERNPMNGLGPTIYVDTSTVCSHTEYEIGKWLHHDCSPCTLKLALNPAVPTSCFSASGAWDASCKAAATTYCTAGERMGHLPDTGKAPLHGECTAGAKLNKYGSACTYRVCDIKSSCCTSTPTGWDSTCVSIANENCTGGREHTTAFDRFGFCGTVLPFLPTTGG